jgi:hypothetical protein
MDQQEQQRINQAADEFTNALVESFRVVSDRGVNAQEQGARLTENFFNRVVENLRSQAGDNRQMTQQLADQKLRAEEAKRTLAQESVGAYMEFVNTLISMSRVAPEAAKQAEERSK